MRIREVALTATDLRAQADFYRDVLRLPTEQSADRLRVDIGTSRLIITRDEAFAGVHHLAFGITPGDLDTALAWLRERVELIRANGSELIDGPEGWLSRSLYFHGPEGIVLELIARQADTDRTGGDGSTPRLLSISEVGIGVPDVPAAVRTLAETFDLPPFPPQLPDFAPVGDHDGLLILARTDRIWFPTESDRPARGPLAVHIELPERHGKLALTPGADIEATAS
ncbi:hypothetical protein NDR87_07925 [Nocardia sp. CDC159]|uniref:VOC domain-containing protein n=1 Tax=Nocardia pulmonis TaxID=2951408 RepID=A0A9X2E349_9NOCA|nr:MULTISPECIES: hypothetical protein [Nocardia]MCM6773397.1 hypothetical protein [Nocardia pulmonis]MCM6786284.1 hypothetical protein [Nocardia sp. CDC159]